MIKTFRGLMQDGDEQRLNLHTNDGKTGYRIVKFQLMPSNYNVTDEYNFNVFSNKQDSAVSIFNFSDQTLLAAAYYENSSGVGSEGLGDGTVIFDKEIVNQDIFIYAKSQAGASCNYYIELEQVSLDLNASTVATLQSIRTQTSGTVLPP